MGLNVGTEMMMTIAFRHFGGGVFIVVALLLLLLLAAIVVLMMSLSVVVVVVVVVEQLQDFFVHNLKKTLIVISCKPESIFLKDGQINGNTYVYTPCSLNSLSLQAVR